MSRRLALLLSIVLAGCGISYQQARLETFSGPIDDVYRAVMRECIDHGCSIEVSDREDRFFGGWFEPPTGTDVADPHDGFWISVQVRPAGPDEAYVDLQVVGYRPEHRRMTRTILGAARRRLAGDQ